jgi:hypothetical protein
MGYQNISLVFAHWGHLHNTPFRLLTYMAFRARDTDVPPKFYEGREACAVALGRMTPAEPAPGDTSRRAEEYRKARRADFEAVRVATQALVKAGAISVSRLPGPRQTTAYVLSLTPSSVQAEPAEQPRVSLPTAQDESGNDPGQSYPQREDNTISRSQTPNSAPGGTSPDAVADYAEASKFLQGLPEAGQPYMLATADLVTGMRERVLVAADMARRDVAAGLKLRGSA